MLSRLASEFAAEIAQHDWSDAPYRADRAGHNRDSDSKSNSEQLEPRQAEIVRLNVIWVTGQVLGHADPNFDIVEYAAACGEMKTQSGWLKAGLRTGPAGGYHSPGTYDEYLPDHLGKTATVVRSSLRQDGTAVFEDNTGAQYVRQDGRLTESSG